jgi:glucose/arabinose dehydrogenase|tara:strand:+ start:1521 stop:2699 length:1179 start_codon:yes stop_codon:yes gene_type:complete
MTRKAFLRASIHFLGGAVAVFAGLFTFQFLVDTWPGGDAVVAIEVGRYQTPMALVEQPGSTELLLGERAGRVLGLDVADDGTLTGRRILLDISDHVSTEGEGGLVGLAVSPRGDYLYVSYTDLEWHSQVDAYKIHASQEQPNNPRTLLDVVQPFVGHNNGHILTDKRGRLLVGFGDGGTDSLQDPLRHSRNRGNLLGTLVRIQPTPEGNQPYRIPFDNPFHDRESQGVRPEILAFGLRNPWRFDVDPVSGDLWLSDVGHQLIEEINYLPLLEMNKGADFGWSRMEGSTEFYGPEPEGHMRPIHEYRHDDIGYRCSIIGGVVVRGNHLPSLEGSYLFSDLCDGRIQAIRSSGDESEVVNLGATVESPVSFSRLSDGTVYVLSLSGGIYRLDPA